MGSICESVDRQAPEASLKVTAKGDMAADLLQAPPNLAAAALVSEAAGALELPAASSGPQRSVEPGGGFAEALRRNADAAMADMEAAFNSGLFASQSSSCGGDRFNTSAFDS